jgi:deoxyribodipyrimidine photo-lyase
MRGLVWFRRDLRIQDNPALTAAVEECEDVVPLFVFDEPLLRARLFGSACVNFMLQSLHELSITLSELGLELTWRRGEPLDELRAIIRERGIDRIYWNRDYEPGAVQRDRLVQQSMAGHRVAVRTFKDHVIFEADEVRGSTGKPLQRYGAYRKRWWDRWRTAAPSVLPRPSPRQRPVDPATSRTTSWPSAEELGYKSVAPWIVPGEDAARKRLDWFLNGPIRSYARNRNLPAEDGTSRLSPYFRFGTITPRTAVHAAMASLDKSGAVSRADVLTWVDEIIWRDFFQQVLTAFPAVAAGPFRADAAMPPAREPGRERDRLFEAWRNGRTGYPLVDAGMRQLMQTGWMHNRVRMIVASFLVKDLRLDWQSGERHFMRQLLDADMAANNGNWQWCTGTGTDAMRPARIFNPVLQSKRFDGDGRYIRTYVPELARVPSSLIHEPHLLSADQQQRFACRIGSDYPRPIVDHSRARQEYLELAREAKERR